jgi:hypothetical protein
VCIVCGSGSGSGSSNRSTVLAIMCECAAKMHSKNALQK